MVKHINKSSDQFARANHVEREEDAPCVHIAVEKRVIVTERHPLTEVGVSIGYLLDQQIAAALEAGEIIDEMHVAFSADDWKAMREMHHRRRDV